MRYQRYTFITIGGLFILALVASLIVVGVPSRAQVANFSTEQQVAPIVNLNLRSGPATTYMIVGVMQDGWPATITGAPSYGWYPIDYQGLTGWALGYFLEPYTGVPPAAPAATRILPSATTTQNQGEDGPELTATLSLSTTGFPTTTSSLPTVANDQGVLLGVLTGSGNLRDAPTLTGAVIKGWWAGRKVMIYQSVQGQTVNGNNIWYVVGEPPEREQVYYIHSSLVSVLGPVAVIAPRYRLTGHWVDVNLTQQTLTAFDGKLEVMHTLISSGTRQHPTDPGVFQVYWRLEKQTMENTAADKFSPDYYRLPDVPYPQYFNLVGDAIHGTYWHDNFGMPMSHGCINATTPAAQWLYQNFTSIGTTIVVHY